jgi:WD40 repeat protein
MPALSAAISLDNSAKVVQIARWGMGNVNKMIFSPDGQHLAVSSSIGIYIFRVSDLTQESLIESETNIQDLVYSPDGTSLIFDSGDSIKILDIATGTEIRSLSKQSAGWIVTSAFSPDGKVIAVSYTDCSLRLWDVQTGKEVRKFLPVGLSGCHPASRVGFSADGSTLAASSYVYGNAGTSYGILRVWDVATGKLRYLYQSTTDAWVKDGVFALSPDGKFLAFRLDTLKIRDLAAQKTIQEISPLEISGPSLAFSSDGTSLTDGTGIWDTGTWKKVTSLSGGGVLSPDWKYSASFSNSAIAIRDAVSGAELQSRSWTSFDVSNLSFSPEGVFLFSGARFWNLLTGQETGYPNINGASRVAFSPDGGTIALLSNQSVSLINKTTGQVMRTADIPYGNFADFLFSPNGKFLVAGERNGKAYTLDLTTWKVYDVSWDSNCLAISPDSKLLASGSSWYGEGGFITIKDPIKGYKDTFGSTHEPGISSITYTPDGKYLIVGSLEGDITLHRADMGAVVKTFKAQSDLVSALIYSPDGKILASSSMDGTIKLWDASTWKLLVTLKGHQAGVSALAFSPDGKMLVSGSEDGTIRFWGIVP